MCNVLLLPLPSRPSSVAFKDAREAMPMSPRFKMRLEIWNAKHDSMCCRASVKLQRDLQCQPRFHLLALAQLSLCVAGGRCPSPPLPGPPGTPRPSPPPSYAPAPPRRPAVRAARAKCVRYSDCGEGGEGARARGEGGACELGTRTSARASSERARVRIELPVRALVGRNEDGERIGPPCRPLEGLLPPSLLGCGVV